LWSLLWKIIRSYIAKVEALRMQYHQQTEILSSPGILWTIHFSAELFSTAQAQAQPSSPPQFWARKHAYIGMPEEETGTGAGGHGEERT